MNRRQSLSLLGASWILPSSSSAEPAITPPLLARTIPSSGESIPVIGLGTWQTFDVTPPHYPPLREVLQVFLQRGGRMIDSSPMYGRSESVCGELLIATPDHEKSFIATKVWTSGRDAGIRQRKESAEKLRRRVIDLMQVHNLLDLNIHLPLLREEKQEGSIRYLGITHYHVSQHDEVIRVMLKEPLDTVQINLSVAEPQAAKKLLQVAKDRNIAVIVNRPFAGGDFLRQQMKQPLPAFAKELECATWAQLLLKWVISHPEVTCAIPATSKAKHLMDNLSAAQGPLPDENLRKRISKACGIP